MVHKKSFKWGYGVILALTCGLNGCLMYEQNDTRNANASQNDPTYGQMPAGQTKVAAPTQKSYASKEPTQKATPGPKRTAAPQLPVIQ